MVNDRQKVSDDLARLTQQLRAAARELAPTQPAASSKLRGALDGWTKTIWARACSAVPTGCAAAISPIRWKRPYQRFAEAGSAGRRCGSRVGHCAARHSRKRRSIARWTIWRGCATSWPDLGGRNPQAGQARQGQPGQRSRQPRGSAVSDQSAQPQRPAWTRRPAGQGRPDKARPRAGTRRATRPRRGSKAGPGSVKAAHKRAVARSAIGSRGRSGNPAQVGNAVGGGGGDRTTDTAAWTPAIRTSAVRPWRPSSGPNPADTQREIDQGLNLLNQVRRRGAG